MAIYSQDVLAKAREYDRASAPLKTRVHALAKQLGLSSKEMIEALGHAGIVVKAASSTVNQNQLEAVLNFMLSTDDAAKTAAEPAGDTKAGGEAAKAEPSEGAAAEDKSATEEAEKPAKKASKKATRKSVKKTSKKAAAKKSDSKKETSEDAAAPEETQSTNESESDKPAKKSTKKTAKKSTRKATKRAAAKPAATEPEEVAAPAETTAPETTAETTAAEAEQTDAPVVEGVQQETAKPRSRRRRARRTVHRGSAAAPESAPESAPEAAAEVTPERAPEEPHEVAEPAEAELHDVEPPATAEPEDEAFEQSRYAPVFLAPQQPSESEVFSNAADDSDEAGDAAASAGEDDGAEADDERQPRPRRRRGRGRGRRRLSTNSNADGQDSTSEKNADSADNADRAAEEHKVPEIDEPQAIRGSTRLEAQRRRRNERREESRKRHVLSEAEFLARRESVERTMVVRERRRHDHAGIVTEVGVLEDDLLVEHFVTSDTQTTQIGNVYLGRVQNVLPSMEAAFVDIGTDRNGVIYAGDLNWKLIGSRGRSRKIEHALKAGDQILVQVTKDPIGHKGARLTMHISLAGRFLVYVPGGRSAGISRKLPEPERKRLKEILQEVTPEGSGTIIRTAAEGVSKEAIADDVKRLETLWGDISTEADEAKARKGAKPITLYKEPDMLVKVVRDVFNEDFSRLVVEGDRPWNTVTDYIGDLAPELEPRLQRYFAKEHGGADVFEHFRIDEQLAKALDRKVWLPSGGTLVIDRTEAMTVIDVNTGKFTGSGGNLEETVTRNNLEAAEEIVRQMRLRDLGGMIVVDFIDMVLPENQELVLRRLKEALGRDRTRHEVSEVTSLGLVQMTRKRLGTGLLETFSTPCSCCNGRGLIIHIDPVEQDNFGHGNRRGGNGHGGQVASGDDKRRKKQNHDPQQHPAALAMHHHDEASHEDASASDAQNQNQEKDQRDLTSDEIVAAAVDAVVVASEQQEPRPPRLKRSSRKSQRSGQRKEQRADQGAEKEKPESKSESKAEEKKADKASDQPLDIAEVAAAAVAEAKEKDPEEPSDDRYVAHHPRRRRRATRPAPTSKAANEESAKPDQSEQAGATDKAKDGNAEADAAKAAESKSGASRRSGRRAARRVRRVAKPVAEQVEIAKAEEKVESGRGGRSYEEAVAEFENSPRRRRPTRGKSRSDRAPRREDFDAEATGDATNAKATDAKVKGSESKPETEANAPAGETKASARKDAKPTKRSGRRSARRTAKRTQQTTQPEPAVAEQSEKPSEASETTAAATRRRRRRAVRRTSTKQTESAAKASSARDDESTKKPKQAAKTDNAAKDRESSGAQKRSGRRRGTRRAVRRSTSN